MAQVDEVKARATSGSDDEYPHVAYGNGSIAARLRRGNDGGLRESQPVGVRRRHALSVWRPGFGVWAASYVRGESPSMRAHVTVRRRQARPYSPEAGVAHRAAGLARWFAGDYREARDHLERALASFEPGRDDDLAFRFGHDPGVTQWPTWRLPSWALGEVDRAISLIDRMQARIAALTHGGTLALGRMHAAMFE